MTWPSDEFSEWSYSKRKTQNPKRKTQNSCAYHCITELAQVRPPPNTTSRM